MANICEQYFVGFKGIPLTNKLTSQNYNDSTVTYNDEGRIDETECSWSPNAGAAVNYSWANICLQGPRLSYSHQELKKHRRWLGDSEIWPVCVIVVNDLTRFSSLLNEKYMSLINHRFKNKFEICFKWLCYYKILIRKITVMTIE